MADKEERRKVYPPQVLSYGADGHQVTVEVIPTTRPPADSQEPSTSFNVSPQRPSSQAGSSISLSSSKAIQLQEMDTEQLLDDLDQQMNEKLDNIEEDIIASKQAISQAELRIETANTSTHLSEDDKAAAINQANTVIAEETNRIKGLMQSSERIKSKFEKQKDYVRRTSERAKKKIIINDVLDETEQALDDFDKKLVNDWQPSPDNNTPPADSIVANFLQTATTTTINQGIPQVVSVPTSPIVAFPPPQAAVTVLPPVQAAATAPPTKVQWTSKYQPPALPPPSQSTPRPGSEDPVEKIAIALAQAVTRSGNRADRKLPNFGGNPADWCKFSAAFQRTQSRYDDAENLMRFQFALQGQAKYAVEHLMANPKNVNKIMEVLEKRYGRPELILDHLVEKAKSSKPVDKEKPDTMIEFGTLVGALVANIESFGQTSFLHDRQLVLELLKKLPISLQSSWYEWQLADSSRQLNIGDFHKWIQPKVEVAIHQSKPPVSAKPRDDNMPGDKPSRNRRGPGFQVHATTTDKSKGKDPCVVCFMDNHKTSNCGKFKRTTLRERWRITKEKKLCFLCLSSLHGARDCKNSNSCSVRECESKYHALLHQHVDIPSPAVRPVNVDNDEAPDTEDTTQSKPPRTVITASTTDRRGELPLVPVKVKGPKGYKIIYALLDSASEVDILQEDVAKEIGLQGTWSTIQYNGVGDMESTSCRSMKVNLHIGQKRHNAPLYSWNKVQTLEQLGLPPRTCNMAELKSKYPYLNRVKGKDYHNVIPKAIVGYPSLYLIAARQILENPSDRNSPCACESLLGWYISTGKSGSHMCTTYLRQNKSEDNMDLIMKNFFSTEDFGVKLTNVNCRSKEDLRAQHILDETTVRVREDKWETGLLWRNRNEPLNSSYDMALRRLHTMERKMDKDPAFATLCLDKFKDYMDKGYLVESKAISDREWYLPWFFSYHPTKKPRLVFDAAAKAQNKSLNDYLLKGPDLLCSLIGVLERFRRHQYVITGDIKEMFHQVSLKKDDRHAQQILFRGMNRSEKPKAYQMTVLFFGSASSPCSAIYTKIKNAEECSEEYPEAVTAIKENEYMDDHLGGSETVESAKQLLQDVIEVHRRGGFPIQKWNSNCPEVIMDLEKSFRSEGSVALTEKSEIVSEKTLGLYWNPKDDTFQFNLSMSKVPKEVLNMERRPTKREMASVIMSVFDPIGFLAPMKIQALILMQQSWKTGMGWDDEIPSTLESLWTTWLTRLSFVKDIRIPRKFTTTSIYGGKIQLHTFVDGSEEAFAAVIYIRTTFENNTQLSFVAGKCRVAPIKHLSIPRLELQAAVLGTRLTQTIMNELHMLKFDSITYWSDSITVLCWLRNVTGRFPTFVSNRIGEILDQSEPNQWRWVPSKLNPADDATRSTQHEDLLKATRWIQGPPFLLSPESTWPRENKQKTEERAKPKDMEFKPLICCIVKGYTGDALPSLARFEKGNSWLRLLRATSFVYVILRKFKNKETSSEITTADMDRAHLAWIKRSQQDSFKAELRTLREGGSIGAKSPIYNLTPSLNEEGIIVMRSRIQNAEVPESVKCPPILNPHHPYVKLMIRHEHHLSGHQGTERVIHQLRQKSWILNCREAVKNCKKSCFICKSRMAKPLPPMMGQLPREKLSASYPFENTGVDYFGPFTVTVGRSTPKRWGVLFTCMTTRAVHLDIAEDLSSSEMINCLTRFINLRGKPNHIWSDNGTNFVGAQRELELLTNAAASKDVQDFSINRGIQWSFIPPGAPHMGGSWERLVGSTKKILDVLLKEQSPRETVMRTLFSEICNILNSRPLCFVSSDPDDDPPITPNDLLNVRCVIGPTHGGAFRETDRYYRSWKYAQLLSNKFWKRWSVEYIPQLAKRVKWHQKTDNLKIGDIVLVLDELAPRNSWKKGIIVEAIKAKDNQVRSAKVRVCTVDPKDKKKIVKTSVFHRPVHKLCLLPVCTEKVDLSERENIAATAAEPPSSPTANEV